VARFDSNVVVDGSTAMPQTQSDPCGQLCKDSKTSLTSRAVLSVRPASDVKHVMTNGMQNI